MTREWYIEHGFKMSALIEQADIDRAEADVTKAYIKPLNESGTLPADLITEAVTNLAFLLLLQRSVALTRGGAKIKTGYNSQEADAWTKLQQAATSCHLAIEELRNYPGQANRDAKFVDICKIYWESNFIAL